MISKENLNSATVNVLPTFYVDDVVLYSKSKLTLVSTYLRELSFDMPVNQTWGQPPHHLG